LSPWPLDDFASIESLGTLDGWFDLAQPATGSGKKTPSIQANTSADDKTTENSEEAPLAARDACFAVSRNGSIVIDFATLIRNAQGKALKLSLGRPGHGTLIRNPNGSYTYRPEAGFVGTDRFPYTVSNGQESASATIELRIIAEEGERPGSSATICIQSEHARRMPQQPERLLILKGKPTGETPKIDWNGIAPVIACAPLWLPAFLTRKDEEELSPQRLAEITGLKFPMDREGQ
jgi:hypothetical protein